MEPREEIELRPAVLHPRHRSKLGQAKTFGDCTEILKGVEATPSVISAQAGYNSSAADYAAPGRIPNERLAHNRLAARE